MLEIVPARAATLAPRASAVARAAASALAAAALATDPGAATAQEPSSAWDSEAAVRIVERAIAARRHAWADSALRRFRADAQGHIHYFGEFRGARRVLRADQLALDVRWQAPDRSAQVLVGRRRAERLPTRMEYHSDHLQLVLDNFGDRISIGLGQEVAGVPHPLAADARRWYEHRLGGSFEIRLDEGSARLVEVQVRPRVAGAPGVAGSVYVERESGAIARMRLTFTPATYLDRQLVGLALDLRNALWEGRYWLPETQVLEIRRSLPWLDFPLETVIRVELRVRGYDFGDFASGDLPPRPVFYSVGREQLAAFDGWEEPIAVEPPGIAGIGEDEVEQVAAEARRLLAGRMLGGGALQLWLPNASAGVRARRGEGLVVGAGASYRLADNAKLAAWGGLATGGRHPAGARFSSHHDDLRLDASGYVNSTRDVGAGAAPGVGEWSGSQAASGLLRTLSALAGGEDYEDPYFASGWRVALGRRAGRFELGLGARVEHHRSATLELETSLFRRARRVSEVDEGRLGALEANISVDMGRLGGASWAFNAHLERGIPQWSDFSAGRALLTTNYARAVGALTAMREGEPWRWSSALEAGTTPMFRAPEQRQFRLGGRGTFPGHEFREWEAGQFVLWRIDASRALAPPFLTGRVFGSVGHIWGSKWVCIDTCDVAGDYVGGMRGSLGLGIALFYEVVRLDIARGLRGGAWTLLFSIDPRLWPML